MFFYYQSRACITVYIDTTSSQTSLAQCPLCRGVITKDQLLEAAQCQEEEDEGNDEDEDDE